MAKYIIEVPHEEAEIPCAWAVKKFLESGSHLLKHADWGCKDGVHKAWVIVDLNNKEEARYLLPPMFRPQACVTGLNKFTGPEIDAILEKSSARG